MLSSSLQLAGSHNGSRNDRYLDRGLPLLSGQGVGEKRRGGETQHGSSFPL
jgi:hypothetical protein